MADYISRDKINEAFDSIFDCADMVFEPDDHCCAADDCGHCKWLQTKNAIKKKLDNIQPADVRPVVLCRDCKHFNPYPGDCTDGGIEGVCKRHNSIGVLVMDEDFCSDAERI